MLSYIVFIVGFLLFAFGRDRRDRDPPFAFWDIVVFTSEYYTSFYVSWVAATDLLLRSHVRSLKTRQARAEKASAGSGTKNEVDSRSGKVITVGAILTSEALFVDHAEHKMFEVGTPCLLRAVEKCCCNARLRSQHHAKVAISEENKCEVPRVKWANNAFQFLKFCF